MNRMTLSAAQCLVTAGLTMALFGCGGGDGPTDAGVPLFVLGGTVTGLESGRDVLLLSGAGTQVTLRANGNFEFPDRLKPGTGFAVTVNRQPTGQTCRVQGEMGTIPTPGNNVRTLTVICAANPFQLGGAVTGLRPGSVLTLADGGSEAGSVTVSADGPFTFPSRFPQGGKYSVFVASQPAGQECRVSSPTGVFGQTDVKTIAVTCSALTPTIGGVVSGLAQGRQLILTNNGRESLTISADGSFVFPSAVGYGDPYSVSVIQQPVGQVCRVVQSASAMALANVTSVLVNCASRTYSVGGSVVGLSTIPGVATLSLQNNGADPIVVKGNGEFSFPGELPSGSEYSITIASQPSGQTCQVIRGGGRIDATDVRSVTVQCVVGAWRSRVLAGTGTGRTVDGISASAQFFAPAGSAFLPSGNLLVAEISGSVLRRVNTQTGQVTTYSGANLPGYADSPITRSAAYRAPHAVAVDRAGNVFVADTGNHVIRRVDAFSGAVSTWAGTGQPGWQDGPGAVARFNGPQGLAVDAAGNVYVADTGNHVIRKIALDQTVSTIAGGAGSPGFADGAPAVSRLRGPAGVAVDASGQLYVADSQNGAIRFLTPAGRLSTLAGNGSVGDADGIGPSARLSNPTAMVVDPQYNIYVADSGNHKIRMVQVVDGSIGMVHTVAGTGRPGDLDAENLGIELRQPYGLSISLGGDLFVSEAGGHRLRVLFRAVSR